MNSKMIGIFLFVTIIINFCNSEPYDIFKDLFILLTNFEIDSFDYQWFDEPSNTIKEEICESMRKARMVYETGLSEIQLNFIQSNNRAGEPAHHGEFSALWQWKNSMINLFPCEWERTDKKKVWFYFTMASTSSLKCYILFVNHRTSEQPLLRQVGVAMEFLNLEALPNGHLEFEIMFSNYKPRTSLLEGYWLEVSPFHTIKATRLENYYLNLQLCGTIAKTLNKLHYAATLKAIPQFEDVLLLLAGSPSKSRKQDLPSSSNSLGQDSSSSSNKPNQDLSSLRNSLGKNLIMNILTCKHYLSVYYLIRHPKYRTMLFVIYESEIHLFRFSKHIHNSYYW